jgi:dipeptidyl aminopeptidase/acylaminoacyl peptidase
MERFRPILCAASLLACALTPVPAAARGLELEDLRQVVSVSAPAIAPDGSAIVYVRSRIDWKNDRRDTELVLVATKDGAQHILTRNRIGVSLPHWSPDGSAIAYLAAPERGKPSQLYVIPMNGGDSFKVTDAPSGVCNYAWRRDSHAFAYTAENEPPKKSDADKPLDAIVITDNDYLTRTAPMPVHLWTVDADGTHAMRMTDGTWSIVATSAPAWSADGGSIYYQRQPDPIFANFVAQTTFVHDIKAATDTSLGYGVDQNPAVSHDGTLVEVTVPRHASLYLTNDASVRSLAGGHEAYASKTIDRNVHGAMWLPHDAGLLVETSDGIRNVAWILDARGSRKIDTGDVDVTQADVANDGAIAFVGQSSTWLPEVYYLAPGASTPKKLTSENPWFSSIDVGKSEAFSWKTDTGATAVGVLTYPVGYAAGKKYPLVMDIHGGPVSTSTWGLSGIEPLMDQVLAKRGYLIFRPNYRGSDNLGDAFLEAIVGDVTSGPGRDNLAAVEALRKLGSVDESRIFVSGWSGGGLQTGWLIGHASFWRAAVAGAGVYDWYQQAVLADINENFAQTFMGGVLPFDKAGRAAYAAESPITFVDAVKTPTLILSDTRDQRVPVSQSYVLYHALNERHVPVTFTAFPRSGHFPTDPVGVEAVMRAWTGWFDRWMN